MNTKRLLPTALLSMLLLGSCSSPEPGITDKAEHQIEAEAEDYSVSRADIQTVLSQLTRCNSSCRKMRAKTASKQYTISTIIDQTGQPAIYVVNYTGNAGFVLLSATKRYIPVLAYSQNGNYSITGDLPDGVQQWQSATVSAISANSILPNDSTNNFKDLWDGYIGVDSTGIGSESHEQAFNVDNVFNEKLAEFKKAGYTIHRMTDESITGDAETDEKLRGEAEYVTYPEYDWHKYAVVLEWTEATDESKQNFLMTTWGQGNTEVSASQNHSYNQYCPVINNYCAPTGCFPVAIGQIMRYYANPNWGYDWDEMPYWYPTPETAQFLRDIGIGINATYKAKSTSATEGAAINYLNNYFKTNLLNYSFDLVFEKVNDNKPVLMTAITTDTANYTIGHAFICSGGSRRTSVTKYTLYTYSGKYTYANVYGAIESNKQYEGYVYLNWGWNGNYDGYYVYNDFSIPNYLVSVKCTHAIYLEEK